MTKERQKLKQKKTETGVRLLSYFLFILRFALLLDCKCRLRFLQEFSLFPLDGHLGEEQDARDDGCDASNDTQTEGPAQVIVGVFRHPVVGVAQTGKDDDCQTAG